MVVAAGVDGELAEEFAEQEDVGSGVGSADVDVAQLAGDAQGTVPALLILSWRTRPSKPNSAVAHSSEPRSADFDLLRLFRRLRDTVICR